MKPIESFTIDHLRLNPGLYVSRKDQFGDTVLTTLDLRMKKPNLEPVMDTGVIHAIEHLGATFLRNHPQWASSIVYFGPMGCRTGFYLILAGDYQSVDQLPLVQELFAFIVEYQDSIPGASPMECGNHSDMDLSGARGEASLYLQCLMSAGKDQLEYPR